MKHFTLNLQLSFNKFINELISFGVTSIHWSLWPFILEDLRKEWKRNQNYSQIPGWPQRNNFISIPKQHIGLWHWLYGVRIILQIKNTLFHITMSRFKFQSYSLSDVWALGTYFFSILGPLSEKWDTHGISLIELLWILNNTCKELE